MAIKSGHRYYQNIAIKEARKNLKNMDGGPFGACIVKDNKILAKARNTVLSKNDSTCHAEINAIRIASKKAGNFDLTGATIYSTTEPCPMCFSAIHWSRISKIFYGTSTSDAKKIGFNELDITDKKLKKLGKSRVKITGKLMFKECKKLLVDWYKLPNKILY